MQETVKMGKSRLRTPSRGQPAGYAHDCAYNQGASLRILDRQGALIKETLLRTQNDIWNTLAPPFETPCFPIRAHVYSVLSLSHLAPPFIFITHFHQVSV